MKFKETKEAYYEFSGKASDILRKLAFAEIATIWLFCIVVDGSFSIPQQLIFPLTLIVGSLISDFCQYLTATIIWGTFHRRNEIKKDPKGNKLYNDDSEISAPGWINWPQNTFFILKIVLIVISSYSLIHFLINAMKS